MRNMRPLLLVAGIVALPALMASLDNASDQSFRERQHERRTAALRTASVAAQLDERLTSIRATLTSIAAAPAMRNPEADGWQGCKAHLEALSDIARHTNAIVRVSVLDGTGVVQCSTDPTLVGQTSGTRPSRDAWRSGEPQIAQGRRREPGTLELAQRVENRERQPVAVMVATAAIGDIVTADANRVAQANDMVFVFDRAGEVLAQAAPGLDARAAERIPTDLRPFLFGQVPGDVEAFGPDGLRRVFAYVPAQASVHGLAVSVGTPFTSQSTLLSALRYPPFAVGVVALAVGLFVGWGLSVRPERKRMRAPAMASAPRTAPAASTDAAAPVASGAATVAPTENAPGADTGKLPSRAGTAHPS